MSDPIPPYEMADLGAEDRREAPAAARNVQAIGDVLDAWLPPTGRVLETSSGTGEHALAFARRFADLEWQPSDCDPAALRSIAAWRTGGPDNLRAPLLIDVRSDDWPIASADVLLSVNMAHIAPWEATRSLVEHAANLLPDGGRLIFYGPWLQADVETAPSNLAFDEQLRSRDTRWGLRAVEDLERLAQVAGFDLMECRQMPANNLMLRFDRRGI
ncbi:DUF938 domain-containing protein [Sphingomicrobium sp. XHP0235]|uniref:DUF938 domain-containing protein n=1 Tax=Sphingomicrobium aquimarinum TaxID=3133971 RepID=UPI0031FE67CD